MSKFLLEQAFIHRKGIAKFVGENVDKLESIFAKLGIKINKDIWQRVKSKSKEWEDDEELDVFQKIWEVFKNLDKDQITNAYIECTTIIKIMRNTIRKINFRKVYQKCVECLQIPAACLQYLWPCQMKQLSTDSQFADILHLQKEVAGACRKLQISEAYLKGIENHDNLAKIDVHRLETFSINDGAECLGKLQKIIEKEITSKDKHVLKRTIELMKMYLDVQTLRYSYITRLCCVVRSIDPQSPTLAGLEMVFDKEEESEIKFLKIFEQPKYENVTFFALFNLTEHNSIFKYLQIKRIVCQDLTKALHRKRFVIHSEKWPKCSVEMVNVWGGHLLGRYNVLDLQATCFEFEAISGVDNAFRFKSVKWPESFVYLETADMKLWGTMKKDAPNREWNIFRLPDGKYMISNRVRPGMFIYMTSILGSLKAADGDHGDEGHWNFTR